MGLTSLGGRSAGHLHFALADALDIIDARLKTMLADQAQLAATFEAVLRPDFDIGSISAGFSLSASAVADLTADLPGVSVAGNLQLAADLQAIGTVSARVQALIDDITGAFSIGQIQTWAYKGAAGKFGTELSRASSQGVEMMAPTDEAFAVILATTTAANWIALSGALYTVFGADVEGATKTSAGVTTGQLFDAGGVPAPTALIGLSAAAPLLQLELATLAQLVAELNLGASLDVSIDPLSLSAALGAALAGAADFAIALPSLDVELDLNIGLDLSPVTIKLDAILNGGAVQVWKYEGPLGSLGSALSGATSGGIAGGAPQDMAYGLVLCMSSPDDWAKLSAVMAIN